MKAIITYSSNDYCSNKESKMIDINSIDELIELSKARGEDLIISTGKGEIEFAKKSISCVENIDFTIEIDDYKFDLFN